MKRWLSLFIMRPVATSLLCIAMVFSGLLALKQLAVAPLPQMDFPMISVSASLPGASPGNYGLQCGDAPRAGTRGYFWLRRNEFA